AFTLWVQMETTLRKILLVDLDGQITQALVLDMVKKSHSISYAKHLQVRSDICGAMFQLQNISSKMGSEVIINIIPASVDIILVISVVWYNCGKFIGVVFLSYTAFDMTVLNGLLTCLLRVEQRNQALNSAVNEFIDHEYEVLSYEETVRCHTHEPLETV